MGPAPSTTILSQDIPPSIEFHPMEVVIYSVLCLILLLDRIACFCNRRHGPALDICIGIAAAA